MGNLLSHSKLIWRHYGYSLPFYNVLPTPEEKPPDHLEVHSQFLQENVAEQDLSPPEILPEQILSSHQILTKQDLFTNLVLAESDLSSDQILAEHDLSSRPILSEQGHSSHQIYSDLDHPSHQIHSEQDVCSHQIHSDLDVSSHQIHSKQDVSCHQVHSDLDLSSHQIHSKQDVSSHQIHSDLDLSSHQIHSDLDLSSPKIHSDLDLSSHQILTEQEVVSDQSPPSQEDHAYNDLSILEDYYQNIPRAETPDKFLGNFKKPSEATSSVDEKLRSVHPSSSSDSAPFQLNEIDTLVDMEIIVTVAHSIGSGWVWLGRLMDIEDEKLDSIEQDNVSKGLEEVSYKMLKLWKRRNPHTATVNVLARYLQKLKRTDIANNILQIARSSEVQPFTHSCSSTCTPEKAGTNGGFIISDANNANFRGVVNHLEGNINIHEHSHLTPFAVKPESEDVWECLKVSLQHKHERMQIPKIPWLHDWELNFKDYFVNLSLQSKDDGGTKELQLDEIFKSKDDKKPSRFLIEGPAGYGKSTLAGKLCHDHAKGEDYIRGFEAVILLRLREFDETFEQLILDTLELKDYPDKLVLDAIRANESKILIVLDGFDELVEDKQADIISVLTGKRFPRSTVIVTTRLGCISLKSDHPDLSGMNLVECVDKRILINGLTGENRIAFVKLYLNHVPEKLVSTIKLVEKKFAVLFNNLLFNCPLFLLLLVIVAEESDIDSLETKTDLYKTLFNFLLRRMYFKQGITGQACDFFNYDSNIQPSYIQMLSQFGSLAIQALKDKQYSFTAEQITSHCKNDDILKLGILTQNDSKGGLKRQSWFEPLHLSLLEFSVAYHIWVVLVSCSTVEAFLILQQTEEELTDSFSLVGPFLFGLCGKQVSALCSFIANDFKAETWLYNFTRERKANKLVAESQLEISNFSEALLPLVPPIYTLSVVNKCSSLLKATLSLALRRKILKLSVVHKHYFIPGYEANSNCLLSHPITVKSESSAKWQNRHNEVITHQDIRIRTPIRSFCKCSFVITICEARLDKQEQWLRKWMTIEGLLLMKPIHKIEYACDKLNLEETLSIITVLISEERVTSVEFYFDAGLRISPELWNRFVSSSNRSKKLVDIRIEGAHDEPLFVDLSGIKGKTWRTMNLGGNVFPRVGPPVVIHSGQRNGYLQNITKRLPATCTQHLCVYKIHHRSAYVFIPNEHAPRLHDLRELHLPVSFSVNLETAWNWPYLNNLQVLAIRSCVDEKNIGTLCSTLVSMLSHCHPKLRLQLTGECLDKLVEELLMRLQKKEWRGSRKQQQKTVLKFHTLMLACQVMEGEELTLTAVNLLKQMLMSGQLNELKICYQKLGKRFSTSYFLKLFASAEGFVCEIGQRIPVAGKPAWCSTLDDTSNYITVYFQDEGENQLKLPFMNFVNKYLVTKKVD